MHSLQLSILGNPHLVGEGRGRLVALIPTLYRINPRLSHHHQQHHHRCYHHPFLCSYSSVKSFDASAVCLNDFRDTTYLIELGLQLFYLSQYLVEAGNFGVGRLDGIAGAVVLCLGRGLSLLVQLFGVFISHCWLERVDVFTPGWEGRGGEAGEAGEEGEEGEAGEAR